MKKLTVSIAVLFATYAICGVVLSGCGDISQTEARQAIVNRFGSEVVEVPDRTDIYVVRDTNGAIWLVNTGRYSSGVRTTNFVATRVFDAR